jgi:hypothetical protein
MAARKPYAATIGPWLTENLGKGWAGPLCGQDWPALKAAAHIAELWCAADYHGREYAAIAFGGVVSAMQPGCRYLAFHAVAHVGDWGMRWQLWQQAKLNDADVFGRPGCKYGPESRPKPATRPVEQPGDLSLEQAEKAMEHVLAVDKGGAL